MKLMQQRLQVVEQADMSPQMMRCDPESPQHQPQAPSSHPARPAPAAVAPTRVANGYRARRTQRSSAFESVGCAGSAPKPNPKTPAPTVFYRCRARPEQRRPGAGRGGRRDTPGPTADARLCGQSATSSPPTVEPARTSSQQVAWARIACAIARPRPPFQATDSHSAHAPIFADTRHTPA